MVKLMDKITRMAQLMGTVVLLLLLLLVLLVLLAEGEGVRSV